MTLKAILSPAAFLCGECGYAMCGEPEGVSHWSQRKPGDRVIFRCLNTSCGQHGRRMFYQPQIVELPEE